MILIFYDEDMNVCVLEYSNTNGVLKLETEECYPNKNNNARLFKEKLAVNDDYIDNIILSIQDRFKDKEVIIFDNSQNDSIYNRPKLSDVLYIYRREITVLKGDVTRKDVDVFANWLYEHLPA